MKTLIIDDVKLNREMLHQYVEMYTPHLEVLGEASSVEDAIEKINLLKPELVLLDIELGDGTAFDIFNEIDSKEIKIIFITAYNHYALEAIKVSAVDYLLKPINVTEFIQAIRKVETESPRNINSLRGIANSMNPAESIVSIGTTYGFETIEIASIIRCTSEGAYTEVYLKDGTLVTATKNLGEFEKILESHGFIRIHHSHMINLSCIKKFNKSTSMVELKNGIEVPVSQRKKKEFLEKINII